MSDDDSPKWEPRSEGHWDYDDVPTDLRSVCGPISRSGPSDLSPQTPSDKAGTAIAMIVMAGVALIVFGIVCAGMLSSMFRS